MAPDRDKEKETRTTNERPVAIPLEFEDALEALLNTPPLDDKDGKQKKPEKEKSDNC